MQSQNSNDIKAGRNAVINQVVGSWKLQNRKLSGLVNKLSEVELLTEVAPGRNRALYLFGHLIASNDMMFPMLGVGVRLFPELDSQFILCPDGVLQSYTGAAELRCCWFYLIDRLIPKIDLLTAEDWLSPPVQDAKLQDEPGYNKLSLLITRAHHQSYHLGQLNL